MASCPNGHPLAEASAKYCPDCGASIPLTPERQQLSMSALGPTCATHPERPSVGTCARCGSFACATCLQPDGRGVSLCAACRARAPETPLPWDQRREIGTIRAYWLTCRELMLHPDATLSRARPEGEIAESLYFAFLSTIAGYATTLLGYVAIFGATAAGLGLSRTKTPITTSGAAYFGIMVAIFVFLLMVGPIVWAIVSSALDHLVLKLVGAQPRSWEVTLRATALSMAPNVIGLVPFCGAWVFSIWSIVLRVFTYRGLHRTTAGKAALGALLLPAVCTCSVFAFYGIAVAAMLGSGKLR